MTKDSEQIKTTLLVVLFVVMMMVLIIMEFVEFHIFEDSMSNTIIKNSLLRLFAGIVFVAMLIYLKELRPFHFRNILRSIVITIPGFIIAVNNFPIIAFLDGRAILSNPTYTIYLFAIECLSVAFFEEIIFRAIILLFLLQKLSKTKRGAFYAIVFSSLIFGSTHLLNVFTGVSFGSSLLQMGYSFLMGMMWAVMYLKTKNLWIVILLHASYNFFGTVMYRLGSVTNRFDTITIVITIILAVLTAVYCVRLFFTLEENINFSEITENN